MSTVKQQAYSTYVICVPSVLWIEKKKVIGGVKGGALKLDCIYDIWWFVMHLFDLLTENLA